MTMDDDEYWNYIGAVCCECRMYGDDYFIDEDGKLEQRCPDCQYFDRDMDLW